MAGFVLCFSKAPVNYNLKGLEHVCQISGFQMEKKQKLHEKVLLCSSCLQELELWLSCFSLKVDRGGSRDNSVEALA